MDKKILQTIKTELNLTLNVFTARARGEDALYRRVCYPIALKGAVELIERGGFTISPFARTPKEGYVVSLRGNEVKIRYGQELLSDPNEIAHAIWSYVRARLHIVRDTPESFFGGWHSAEEDTVYLDLSVIVPTAEEAYSLAVANGQLAIYCLHWQETIDCTSREAFASAYENILRREE